MKLSFFLWLLFIKWIYFNLTKLFSGGQIKNIIQSNPKFVHRIKIIQKRDKIGYINVNKNQPKQNEPTNITSEKPTHWELVRHHTKVIIKSTKITTTNTIEIFLWIFKAVKMKLMRSLWWNEKKAWKLKMSNQNTEEKKQNKRFEHSM